MRKKRFFYAATFLVILAVEIFIALYVHDGFIRPYMGDVLVVAALYFLVKCVWPNAAGWLPLYIFIFAAGVEFLQYFRIVEILGLQDNRFFRILLGSVFDVKDILCYGMGCLMIAVGAKVFGNYNQLS